MIGDIGHPRWVLRANRIAAIAALSIGIACLGHSAWIHAKAIVAQRLIGVAWQRASAGELGAKPWPWADTRPVAKLILGRGSGVLMVLEGSSGRNLAFGPTHDSASVLPGERGNSVIEGHRDTHFSVLKELRIGDLVHVELPGGRRESFVVAQLQIADSRRSGIALESETPRLTLVTCFPFDAVHPGGPLRYVVTANWLPYGASESAAARDSNSVTISRVLLNQPAAGQSSGRSFAGI